MTAMLAVGSSPSNLADVRPDPSVLTWGLQDISASDAGRVHDSGNTMYKNRTSQKRKLNITWNYPTDADVSRILKMFNPEYFYVRYYDLMEGCFQIRCFYAGDRSAPYKWFQLPQKGTVFSTLSFDIIER